MLARIGQLDLRSAKTKVVELKVEQSARTMEPQPEAKGEEPVAAPPTKPRRRWIRRITIRVNRKSVHKRGLTEVDAETRRARLTRKRRRVARGWVRQQHENSDTEGAPGTSGGRRSGSRYGPSGRSNSSPDARHGSGPGPQAEPACQTLVTYHTHSGGRQKPAPLDEAAPQQLPDELVEKLLAWLPVTSALRFRAVCKRWQSILSPEGWRSMFDKPPAWSPCTGFFSSAPGRRECAFFDSGAQRWATLDLGFLPRAACRLLSASGGLLCLSHAGACSCVFICNPMTKSWRELPAFHQRRRRPGTMLVHLLVDTASLSYKVIVIGHPSCSAPSAAAASVTEVYDSRTGAWTAVANIPSSGCILSPSVAFRNGIIYCLTENPTGLLAFNMARKVWRRLEIKSHSRVLCVLEHNGHILIVARLTARVTRLGIWRLRETFPRVWIKVALMPVEHALYFLLSGKFCCFAQGDCICFASPRRTRWLLFHIRERSWTWGSPARVLDPDCYNKWFFYEPRLDIEA
ncbi:hypothetical protein MPTK1_1g15370 [Marchantia polymorpha subsp. ruderalis]|uniref:F-box domain-containing protein n=2 Tax=Marchantia polymorpha TaxID=3197 RepID=A0AAF6AQF8_MARPO|nr:hypothetical protein MARPO_0033s0124 [Marchantia polymorpha]BBM98678.1 hypothetical protein Mp_1g15370 [Marchantia polymorpha subsp. ruderalis]|eukprot:PTQ41730.1 hypothetical protein MARPO_0033s0124 [Marchantia polymorpha]